MRWSGCRATLVAALVGILVACTSGRDFDRPPSHQLKLGTTTRSELLQALGPIRHARVLTMNDAPMDWIAYSYGTTDGGRSLGLYLYKDVLVGHEFVSSLKSDSTNFDDKLVARIEKGRTTGQGVIELLGAPSGEYIHPMVKATDGRALVYLYREVRMHQSMITALEKKLVVTLDSKGTVAEVEYKSDGRAY